MSNKSCLENIIYVKRVILPLNLLARLCTCATLNKKLNFGYIYLTVVLFDIALDKFVV